MSMPTLLHNVKAGRKTEFYKHPISGRGDSCKKSRMKFRLGEFRKRHQMTQLQVATALGISVGLYNQLESGKRRMNETYLENLASIYKVSPVDLIADPTHDDPYLSAIRQAFRKMTEAERKMIADAAQGIASHKA